MIRTRFTTLLGVAIALSPSILQAQSGYVKKLDKDQLEDQIQGFTDVAAKLNTMNQSPDSSACDKLDLVWDAVEGSAQEPDALVKPESKLDEVIAFGNGSVLRFWKVFSGWTNQDWAGKNGKDSDNLGSEIRPYRKGHIRDTVRLTHRYSVNVKLSYVPLEGATALGLTGQYATRNDCVLGRLSSAVPTGVKDRFTPAFSSKFFVDGASESQVLITQHDIGGQSWEKDQNGDPIIDNNFYSKYLSNRLSFEKGATAGVGAFSRFFYTAQYFSRNILGLDFVFDPRELQANHLAEKDVTGKLVAAPKGPRFVWVAPPSPAVREEFRQKAAKDLDFRRHFIELNSKIERGESALFLVYGSDTWTYEPEKEATLIGKFVVNSDFVSSEAADVRLFYKHSIQFHKIPETVGQKSVYTQDYPFAQWGDELFAGDCNLGIKENEAYPVNLKWTYGNEDKVKGFVDFSKGALDGTFVADATVNPFQLRLSRNHEYCLTQLVRKRASATLEDFFKMLK